jgi:hypothetical protein
MDLDFQISISHLRLHLIIHQEQEATGCGEIFSCGLAAIVLKAVLLFIYISVQKLTKLQQS